jgi:uncharacterized protein (DUF302 family)
MAKNFIITVLLLIAAGCAEQNSPDRIYYYQAETGKPYDEILAELEIAITEQNFRITGHSRVGKVIRARGDADFPEFDTIQFCNLTHAKKMLEISPASVRHMPCNVVTYSQGKKSVIKARLLPVDTDNAELNKFSASINDKLKLIVNFAAEQ